MARRSRSGVLLFTLGSALLNLPPVAAWLSDVVHAAEPAGNSAIKSYAISAGPLGDVLAQFAAAAGVPLSFDPTPLADIRSEGLQGSYSVQEGFDRLLGGSGYELVGKGDGAYSLRKAAVPQSELAPQPPESDQQLPEVKVVSEVEVQARYQSLAHELLPEYAGGQVARGGSVGILGNRDLMDTPFNQTNYTAELIQNQQVRHVADILNNDPTAYTSASTSTGADDFRIRGFNVGNTDLLFNGLPGVAPSFFNSMMAESIERVEVLKGPNALLNGAAQGGSVGGAINVVPKRAGDTPLTQFTATYSAKSQLGGHLDVGRRFGPNQAFGIRFNGVYRDGDTAIEDQSRESRLAALGLDYRGERLRLSADLGYQEQDFQGIRDFTFVVPGVQVPDPPDSSSNYDGPNDFSNPKVLYGTLRGEFDFAQQWTAFASIGRNRREARDLLNNRRIIDAQGNLAGGSDDFSLEAIKMYAQAVEVGLRGRFTTGPVGHQLTLAYSTLAREWRRINGTYTYPASNIYHPTIGPGPSSLPDPDDARKANELTTSGTTVVDTLSILDERVQLTLGARLQRIELTQFDFATGAVAGEPYDEDAVTPMVALVLRPSQHISIYGNYIEGLEQGPAAPSGTANAGEVFAPSVTEQYEAGVKLDFGRLGATLSLYQIARPNGIIDPITNIFDVDGEQRHRGVDFNVFGEVANGVRLLGGAAYINSDLTKTEGGVNEGNRGVTVPKWRLVLSAEWDTPFIPGLTVSGRVIRNGSMYLDPANTQSIPAWTRLDIGARYRIERAGGKAVTLRANLDNALDKSYWDGSESVLILGDPRTFSLSATFDF